MKILYLSCHSILEADEYKLFTELGHEVFAIGSYINPTTPHDPKRPPIDAPVNEYLLNVALQSSQDNLHAKMIEWADVVYVMHRADWITSNWEKIKHKKIIWRSIGQSTPALEAQVSILQIQGVKIVRYSPEEQYLGSFAGYNAVIRFYKDPNEWKGYNGKIPAVVTVGQSMKERNRFCGYDIFARATEGLERHLYGTPSRNPDLTLMDDPIYNGQLSFDDLKKAYQDHRVYFYTGTYPAPYTLNLIEAMMTGIPVVAIGKELADIKAIQGCGIYEVDKIIQNGINGFISNDLDELHGYVEKLINDPILAKQIGDKGRQTAIELFGNKIKQEWKEFFDSL